jgi:hypothetical protein
VPHHVEACHPGRPVGGCQQGHQDADGGRLAGPVRAEEAKDRSRGDGQVDPVDGDHLAAFGPKDAAQAGRLDDVLHV